MSPSETAAEEVCSGGLVRTKVTIASRVFSPTCCDPEIWNHWTQHRRSKFFCHNLTIPTSSHNCLHGSSCQNTQNILTHREGGDTSPSSVVPQIPTCNLSSWAWKWDLQGCGRVLSFFHTGCIYTIPCLPFLLCFCPYTEDETICHTQSLSLLGFLCPQELPYHSEHWVNLHLTEYWIYRAQSCCPVHAKVLNTSWVNLPGKEISGLTLPSTGCQSQPALKTSGHGILTQPCEGLSQRYPWYLPHRDARLAASSPIPRCQTMQKWAEARAVWPSGQPQHSLQSSHLLFNFQKVPAMSSEQSTPCPISSTLFLPFLL